MVQAIEEPAFGTSGLRGLSVALTDALVADYAATFCRHFPNNGTLYVGRDLRDSSPRLLNAVAQGAAEAGLTAIDCGVLPTPALALAAMGAGTISIMVTGSHIPADRNGLKFYRADGEITKVDETRMQSEIARVSLTGAKANPTKGHALESYRDRYVDFFGSTALLDQKIGFWSQSSAAREVLPDILRHLGATVVELDRSDIFVPVDTEAVDEEVRAKLKAWSRDHEFDAIVSTDGDADRPLLADDKGSVVPGDILGPLTARLLNADAIVTPVSANTLVDRMDDFTKVQRCRIGSPYVISGMTESDLPRTVGYEPNGGFLLGYEAIQCGRKLAPLMTRDAILPIVAVLVAAQGTSVSKVVEKLPKRRTATDRLEDVPRERSSKIVEDILAGVSTVFPEEMGEIVSTDTTDGARLTFANEIVVHIRPSGNAPELRCYVEAETSERARAVLADTLVQLRSESS